MRTSAPRLDKRVRQIVVVDEDPKVVSFAVGILRNDGHAVFHAFDVLSVFELALETEFCDLVISNTNVAGAHGVDLIVELRSRRPNLPIMYLANVGRSSPELEAELPVGVPILREPFTADDLRAYVGAILDGDSKQLIGS